MAAALGCGAAPRTAAAGFYYEDAPLALPASIAEQVGGPLTARELASIQQTSRAEVERAFNGFNIRFTENRGAFWRVAVVRSLPGRGRPLPSAGESIAMGFMGGAGAVSFDLVSRKAVQYAPAGASRLTMIDGIGRGIGRVAAHEFAHQVLNTSLVHNAADEASYEYPSPDRSAQYYGELHWTTARTLLAQRLR